MAKFDYSMRGPAVGTNFMASSGHPLATSVGLQMFNAGGNAFDAAVAMAAAIAVAEPAQNHLGGDAFALIRNAANGDILALNASGPAPSLVEPTLFKDGIPIHGLRSATVPGAVAAWDLIAKTHGRLPIGQLLEPAIEMAKQGIPVTESLHQSIVENHHSLQREKDWVDLFAPFGKPLQPGEVLKQPDLANILAEVATGGAEAFYQGSFAEKLDAHSKRVGGLIRSSDLKNYRCEFTSPIYTTYNNYDIYGQPPVSQGYVLLSQLNMAEALNLHEYDFGDPTNLHIMLECKKLAYKDRHRYLGDPEFVSIYMDTLLDKEFAKNRTAIFDNAHARHRNFDPVIDEGTDTTCLSAADKEGNMVTYIQSLFHAFGCGQVIRDTGVIMNNRMCGFSIDPNSPNKIEANKRPIHTLNTYMLASDGMPILIGATRGAHFQVQTNFQIISNIVDHGMNIQEAMEAPRWSHDETDGRVLLENRFSLQSFDDLKSRGHDIHCAGSWGNPSCTQGIAVDTGNHVLLGGTDPRWHGIALGS
tara:strand:- start:1277 stop:2866 length:1590 start_codon:yes stop_codon:yes gene_type:complete